MCQTEPAILPYMLSLPELNFTLHTGSKLNTPHVMLKTMFYEVASQYTGFTHMYTDGSKDSSAVSAAVVSTDGCLSVRLPDHCSVFTAECRVQ